jgi:hypothetical protein
MAFAESKLLKIPQTAKSEAHHPQFCFGNTDVRVGMPILLRSGVRKRRGLISATGPLQKLKLG